MSADENSQLAALFDREREVRRQHDAVLSLDLDRLEIACAAAVAEAKALEEDGQEEEANLRLTRLALVLSELEGPRAVDLLIDILSSSSLEARAEAGEALEHVAFDRFKEVALGVERALDRLAPGSAALSELPYLLAEVAEPGSLKLLERFLHHRDPEAVASAIEALVELADPAAAALLEPLARDSRRVQIEEDSSQQVSLGELAQEACDVLLQLSRGVKATQ